LWTIIAVKQRFIADVANTAMVHYLLPTNYLPNNVTYSITKSNVESGSL